MGHSMNSVERGLNKSKDSIQSPLPPKGGRQIFMGSKRDKRNDSRMASREHDLGFEASKEN